MDAAYIPNLDSYLVPLIPGIKNPDQSLREMHDKICDMFGQATTGILFHNPTEREQVLTKLNPSLSSLGKEQFPDSGKQLFGDGFEASLKARSETARTVAAANSAGKAFFPRTVSWG